MSNATEHPDDHVRVRPRHIKGKNPDYACAGCGEDVNEIHEYAYMVNDPVWKKSLQRARCHGIVVSTYDLVCIRCLEFRLGRMLLSDDFAWDKPLTWSIDSPRSRRLIERMGDTRLVEEQDKGCGELWRTKHKSRRKSPTPT